MVERCATNSYAVFQNHLSKFPKQIACPECEEVMLTNVFETHCKDRHELNPAVVCVFCRNFTWPRGQKRSNGKHLHACLKEFTNRNRSEPMVLDEPVVEEPAVEEICPCASFRSDRLRRRTEQVPAWTERDRSEGGVHLMYDRLFESDAEWCRLPEYNEILRLVFEDDRNAALLNGLRFHPSTGLEDAVEWIKRYVCHEKRFGWYHVCVRAGCMKSFVESVRGLDIVELPHWCVCRGRPVTESDRFDSDPEALKPGWRHHRHAILVVRDKLKFKRSLEKKVRYTLGVTPDRGKRYHCNEIKNVNHFVSTIAYVSTSPSKCKCDSIESGGWMERISVETKMLASGRSVPKHSLDGCHYFLEKPVVPHAVVWMLMAAPSGALERYGQFRVGPRCVEKLKSKKRIEGKWRVSACEELAIRNCVVLFDGLKRRIGEPIGPGDWLNYLRNYCDSDRWFAYWFGGRVLRVARWNDGPDDDLDRFREYCFRNGTNVLFNFRDSWFPLSFRGQKVANALHGLEVRHGEHVKRLKFENETLVKRLCESYERRIRELEAKLEKCREEIDAQKTERISELKESLKSERSIKRAMTDELKETKKELRDLRKDYKTLQTHCRKRRRYK